MTSPPCRKNSSPCAIKSILQSFLPFEPRSSKPSIINALILLHIFIPVNDNCFHYIFLIPAIRLADHEKKYYNESRSFMKEDVF